MQNHKTSKKEQLLNERTFRLFYKENVSGGTREGYVLEEDYIEVLNNITIIDLDNKGFTILECEGEYFIIPVDKVIKFEEISGQ